MRCRFILAARRLYKIILTPAELETLNADEIRELAKKPRALTVTDATGFLSRVEVKENRAAGLLLRRIQHQLKNLTRKPFEYKFSRPADLSHIEFPCAGAQAIWQRHIEPGQRNNCAIRLASELRLLGLGAEECARKLLQWNDKNRIELSGDELASVVHSAYQHRFPYRYGCRDMVLRRYCPLPGIGACQAFVARKATPEHPTDR